MNILKQSTAATIQILCTSTTDASRQTGLTITQAETKLSKNGGTYAQKNDANSAVEDANGNYKVSLNTTDVNTLGRLTLDVVKTGTLFYPMEFLVVTANVYDTMCSTDSLDVNLNADQSAATVGTVTTLTNKTGFALSAAGVDAVWDEALSGHTGAGTTGLTLLNALKYLKNKWAISGTTLTIYDDNGTDALYQFTLDSATAPTSRTPV